MVVYVAVLKDDLMICNIIMYQWQIHREVSKVSIETPFSPEKSEKVLLHHSASVGMHARTSLGVGLHADSANKERLSATF